MLTTPARDASIRWFLTAMGVVGIGLVLVATARYGAGVSSDAARNLSTADNLLQGRGFVDMLGSPFVLWPPLYPLVLAGLSLATTLTTFQVAWFLNAVLYGVNIWLAGWLLHLVFRETPLFTVVGCLIIVFSRSLLRIHANVASEPLFFTLMLGSLLSTANYLETGSSRSLWAMCTLAGLGSLQRYLGTVLLGVVVAAIWRRAGLRGLRVNVGLLLLAGTPLAAWALLHNLPLSGAAFGPRELGTMLPVQNMGLAVTKILWWFLPRWGALDWVILHPWVPLLGVLVLLAAFNRRRHFLAWLKALLADTVWPGLLFGIAYFLLLAFTVVTADHLDLTSDRYYVVLLPIVLIAIFITLDRLVLDHLGSHRPRGLLVVAGLLGIWSVYPFFAMHSYLRLALQQGEPTNYNIANSAHFREMGVVKAAEQTLRSDPNALVYSNYVNIVWFILGHPVQALPFQDESLGHEARLAALARNHPNWPQQPGYIVWFIPNEYHHIVPPADLSTIAELTLLFEDETGQVFGVSRRAE